MTMGSWIAVVMASVSPVAYLPGLRRIIRNRTTDGVSQTLCGVGVVSYGMWLGLATRNTPAMFLVLTISSMLALTQLVLVTRLERRGLWSIAPWLAAATIGGVAAWQWQWAAVAVLVVVDAAWYTRALRDILRSRAAAAVSPWGWTLTIIANLSWVYDGIVRSVPTVVVQATALTCAASVALAATILVQRRAVMEQAGR